jgi:hypothetical protein
VRAPRVGSAGAGGGNKWRPVSKGILRVEGTSGAVDGRHFREWRAKAALQGESSSNERGEPGDSILPSSRKGPGETGTSAQSTFAYVIQLAEVVGKRQAGVRYDQLGVNPRPLGCGRGGNESRLMGERPPSFDCQLALSRKSGVTHRAVGFGLRHKRAIGV